MSSASNKMIGMDGAFDALANITDESKKFDRLIKAHKDMAIQQGGVSVVDFGAIEAYLKVIQRAINGLHAVLSKEVLVAQIVGDEEEGPKVAEEKKEN